MSFWKKKTNELNENIGTPSAPVSNKSSLVSVLIKSNIRDLIDPSLDLNINDYLNKYDIETIKTALSKGTNLEGKLSFDNPVQLSGEMSGEVYSTDVVFINKSSKIRGELIAETVFIAGEFEGSINASKAVIIQNGANVDAIVKSPVVIKQKDCFFNGSLV